MSNFLESCSQIISGTKQITNHLKLSVLMFCISLVHLGYTCFFYLQGVTPLFLYNLCVIFLYIGSCMLMYHHHYKVAALFAFFEVCTSSLLVCIFIGWNCGFGLFLLAMIPIIYYMIYSAEEFQRKIFTPTLLSLISFFVFLFSRAITLFFEPIYGQFPQQFTMLLYLFNAFFSFSTVILFSLFFLLEIRNVQRTLRLQNEHLDKIASIDTLTRLLNRRSMKVFLDEAIYTYETSGLDFSLILCDIDDFKKVNDTYGHECGDHVLIHIAALIQACVQCDDYVCRWGGEEILILVHGPIETAGPLAERIRLSIEATPTVYGRHTIFHTMTFGISSYKKGRPIEESIQAADKKLYLGKSRGKNQIVI